MSKKNSFAKRNKKQLLNEFHELDELESKPTANSFKINNPFKLNPKQKAILGKMGHIDTKIVLVDAVWGSSKTFLSVLASLQLLQHGHIDKIIYIRNPCESSDTSTVGTLPGNLGEKMHFYDASMMDKLSELLIPSESKKLLDSETIEFIPPSFLRGRNFARTVLLVDEASNLSFSEILLISSRMAEGSRMFMVGDTFQNDIGKKSGFKKFFDLMNDEESVTQGIHCFEMKSKDDIVRSGIIRYIMEKTGVIKS